MRILVIGATGYVASRAIPQLVRDGHEVVAAARSPEKLDRFWWRENVSVRELDVLDRQSVVAGVTSDVDAVLYLVHGLAGKDFHTTDREAAEAVSAAVDAADIPRVVYVSGIIPPIKESSLSGHLRSRLQVEQVLSSSRATTVTLRAAMIVGAASTSYALMAQLARRLPLTVMPDWMDNCVEPLAIVDLVAAISASMTVRTETRHYDIGGGTPIRYPELVSLYLRDLGDARPAVEVPYLPQMLVGEVASRIADIPGATVRALIQSLRSDMVAANNEWIGGLVAPDYRTVDIADAFARARAAVDYLRAPSERDPMQPLPGDPRWANTAP